MNAITDNNVARLVDALNQYDKTHHTFTPLFYVSVKQEIQRITTILLQRKHASIDDKIGTFIFHDTLPDESRQLIKYANVLREESEDIEMALLYLEGHII